MLPELVELFGAVEAVRLGGLAALASAVFYVWNELWVGALSIHDRHLTLDVTRRPDAGDGRVEWRIGYPQQGGEVKV